MSSKDVGFRVAYPPFVGVAPCFFGIQHSIAVPLSSATCWFRRPRKPRQLLSNVGDGMSKVCGLRRAFHRQPPFTIPDFVCNDVLNISLSRSTRAGEISTNADVDFVFGIADPSASS